MRSRHAGSWGSAGLPPSGTLCFLLIKDPVPQWCPTGELGKAGGGGRSSTPHLMPLSQGYREGCFTDDVTSGEAPSEALPSQSMCWQLAAKCSIVSRCILLGQRHSSLREYHHYTELKHKSVFRFICWVAIVQSFNFIVSLLIALDIWCLDEEVDSPLPLPGPVFLCRWRAH